MTLSVMTVIVIFNINDTKPNGTQRYLMLNITFLVVMLSLVMLYVPFLRCVMVHFNVLSVAVSDSYAECFILSD